MYRKDSILAELIPDKISQCALHLGNTEVCVSNNTINILSQTHNLQGLDGGQVMRVLKDKFHCESDRCVIEKSADVLGQGVVDHEISINLKVKGPTDNALLSNINIDTTLIQWSKIYEWFFPYNFNMLNYVEYSYRNGRVLDSPDTLATIQVKNLITGQHNGKKYTCAACVINSDRYQGPGKHWMALFVDARDNINNNCTVEFFNSSGRNPAPEWVNWMEKTKTQLISLGKNAKIVRATTLQQQESRSECGLYSLFYIWARLHNVPHQYFESHRIPDRFMFEFRQHLFDDGRKMEKFDWEEYKKTVKIQWE